MTRAGVAHVPDALFYGFACGPIVDVAHVVYYWANLWSRPGPEHYYIFLYEIRH